MKSENGPISDFKNPGFRSHKTWFKNFIFFANRNTLRDMQIQIKIHTVYTAPVKFSDFRLNNVIRLIFFSEIVYKTPFDSLGIIK